MARIVLDSNLIARALISPNGLAAEILFRVLTEDHLPCSSNFMLAELDRILRYPRLRKVHGLTDERIPEFVASIQVSSFVVDIDITSVRRITRDINDDPIIETAIQAKAAILCSNDKDVLGNTVVDFCMPYGIQVLNDVSLIKLLSGR